MELGRLRKQQKWHRLSGTVGSGRKRTGKSRSVVSKSSILVPLGINCIRRPRSLHVGDMPVPGEPLTYDDPWPIGRRRSSQVLICRISAYHISAMICASASLKNGLATLDAKERQLALAAILHFREPLLAGLSGQRSAEFFRCRLNPIRGCGAERDPRDWGGKRFR